MKRRLMLLILILAAGVIIGSAYAQQDSPANTTAAESASAVESREVSIHNIDYILSKAGNTRYFIYAVLASGLFLVVFQFSVLAWDRKKSARLRRMEIDKTSMAAITSEINERPDSSVAQAISMLSYVYSTTRDVGLLNDEINSFLTGMRIRFSAFTNWLVFLSDSAGALGLLGTVIGMFSVFFQGGGDFDNRAILDGMGIALITTLLGIIVSLILNLLTTVVTNFHNRNLEYVMEKSDEFRIKAVLENKIGQS